MKLNLSYFGGKKAFCKPKSTSNLVKPNIDNFKNYIEYSLKDKNEFYLKELFEEKFSKLHGAKYCIPVVNGLWALVVAIKLLKIEGKSEIIIPSLTYRRMADIAAWLGLTPRFCDVEFNTFSVTKENIESCINEETAIIIAPHSIVNVCDVYGIEKLSASKNIPVIFDSVESYYAEINNKTVGGFGNAEIFSLHASKFLNGFEGGYITTNDDELASKLKIITNGGIVNEKGGIEEFGLNLNLIDYHLAMALSCLDDIESQIIHNKIIYKTYKQLISKIEGIRLIEYSEIEKRSFKNILVEIEDSFPIPRNILIEILQAENLIVRPYYYPPLHEMTRAYKTKYEKLPNTEYWKKRLLLMPSGYQVEKDDVYKICEIIEYCQTNHKDILKLYEEKSDF